MKKESKEEDWELNLYKALTDNIVNWHYLYSPAKWLVSSPFSSILNSTVLKSVKIGLVVHDFRLRQD